MSKTDTGTLKVGVIGCGVIAYWVHLRLLQQIKGVDLVVASDPSSYARARAARITRARIVESADEIISDRNVDAVVVCSPTHTHADIVIAALNAGKHVMVEKPIATNAHDAQRVLSAAEGTGLSASVGFNRRSHPLFEQAKRLVASGELGEIHAVQSAFCEPMIREQMSGWRQRRETGGGVLLDLASHHIDLAMWLLNNDVESVQCVSSSKLTEDDTASLSLTMKRGVSIQGFFSYRAARADYVELIGEKGTLLIDNHRSRSILRVSRRFGYGTRQRFLPPDVKVAAWQARRLVRPSFNPSYRSELVAFVNSTRGESKPIVSLAEAKRALDVVLAAEDSARSNRRVRVDPPVNFL